MRGALSRPRPPRPAAALVAHLALAVACSPPERAARVGEFGSEGVGRAAADRASLVAAIDEVVMAPVRDGRIAGASVAVVHRGEAIAVRGYGWANLPLRAPTPADAVYEIGSVTKQFTAAALLRLQERGLVDLDADVNRYLPDFPLRGNRVAVRDLLDHTSGIRGYTETSEARPHFSRRAPRDTLIAVIAAHPFDFPPGERQVYNNSAYFLAGAIVEEVSGTTYEEYVEGDFFAALGMERSHYCSEREIHEGKVDGYDVGPEGLVHKGFIVHSVPFAAGSLCSSAGDLAAWLGALHGGRVLEPESYAEMVAPSELADGTSLRYGLGLSTADVLGHRALSHGGSIYGFLSEAMYLPDEDLAVVVLVNTAGPTGPTELAKRIVRLTVGDATPAPTAFHGDPSRFEGTYSGWARAGEATIAIALRGDALTATAVVRGGRTIPEDARRTDVLAYRGGATFAVGDELFVFEGDGERADVLRWDVATGHSIMRRR